MGEFDRATTLYAAGPEADTMMQSCASAASSEAADPSLFPAWTPLEASGPRHLELSSALDQYDRAETDRSPTSTRYSKW